MNDYLLPIFFLSSMVSPYFAVSNNAAPILHLSQEKPVFLHNLKPVFTLTTGATFSPNLGEYQSMTPLDLCRYSYNPNGNSKVNVLWGGFVGAEIKRTSNWGLITGIGYYYPTSMSTNGILTQGADVVSNNMYTYKYQTQNQQLLAEGKWYWIAKENIHPFLMIGAGTSFNRISAYQTNVPPFLEFTPTFSNHTQTNFTYAVGPGVDVSVTKSFSIGLSYRFTDFGPSNTGTAQIDSLPISNTLKQPHQYTNQILAQFTYTPWAN